MNNCNVTSFFIDADDDEITDAIEYLQDVADVHVPADSLTQPIKVHLNFPRRESC